MSNMVDIKDNMMLSLKGHGIGKYLYDVFNAST
jgi:hypothetical protein